MVVVDTLAVEIFIASSSAKEASLFVVACQSSSGVVIVALFTTA